jgi:hypothetical protein
VQPRGPHGAIPNGPPLQDTAQGGQGRAAAQGSSPPVVAPTPGQVRPRSGAGPHRAQHVQPHHAHQPAGGQQRQPPQVASQHQHQPSPQAPRGPAGGSNMRGHAGRGAGDSGSGAQAAGTSGGEANRFLRSSGAQQGKPGGKASKHGAKPEGQ